MPRLILSFPSKNTGLHSVEQSIESLELCCEELLFRGYISQMPIISTDIGVAGKRNKIVIRFQAEDEQVIFGLYAGFDFARNNLCLFGIRQEG